MQRVFRPSVQACKPPCGLAHNIRIVTYNILADKYKGFNSYCSPGYLDWSYRYPKILQEIQSYKPDILCLQEVEQTVYYQQLQPWMEKQGYCSLYQPRSTPAEQQGPDEGVSLHYRSADFTAVAHQAVKFADADLAAQLVASSSCSRVKADFGRIAVADTTTTTSNASSNGGNGSNGSASSSGSDPSQSQSCRKHRGEHRFFKVLMQREEGCVMALLRHNISQQVVLACSTHLFWNPLFPDVKVAQAAVLCSSIAQFIQQQGYSSADVAVVVGGDFNSMPVKHVSDKWDEVPNGKLLTSGVYQLLQQGQLYPTHQDHPARRTLSTNSSSSNGVAAQQEQQQPALLQDHQQQLQQVSSAQQQQQQHQPAARLTEAVGGIDPAHVTSLDEQLDFEPGSDGVDNVMPLSSQKQRQQWQQWQQQQHAHHKQQQQQPTSDESVDAADVGPSSPVASVLSSDSTWEEDHANPAAVPAASTTGDCNGSSSSSSSLAQHVFAAAGLDLVSSSYMAHVREPVLTTRTTSFSGCLDYIWLSKQHFQVAQTLAMPYPDPGSVPRGSPDDLLSSSVFGPCPNELFPSDHLAVGCDVALLPVSSEATVKVASEAAVVLKTVSAV